MSIVRVEVGDGPREVTVTGMSRTQWSAWGDEVGEDARERALIAACTGLDPDEVMNDWPADAADVVLAECERLSTPSWKWALPRIKGDPYMSLTLALCQEMGIPHSTFTAWPARDQDLALARYVIANDRCPGCSAPTEAQRNPALAHLTSVECLVCMQIDAAHDEIAKHDPTGALSRRTHMSVIPVEAP